MGPKVRLYLWQVLIALDQLANAVLGGYPDETLSARAWRKAQAGQWFWRLLRRLIDGLFRLTGQGPGHCRASYENEQRGGHRPRELRENHETV